MVTKMPDDQLWVTFAEHSDDHFWMITPDYQYVCLNDAHARFFNATPQDFYNNNRTLITNDFITCIKMDLNRVFKGEHIMTDHDFLSSSGQPRTLEIRMNPVYDHNKRICYAACVARDVTEYKARQSEIEYSSYHDYLTNLYNRRYFEQKLEQLDIPINYPLTVIMMDLNGLKLINDTYGHHIGDLALKRIGYILNNVFYKQGVIARIGGDEFAVILSLVDEAKITLLTKRLMKEVSRCKIENINLSLAYGYDIKRHHAIEMSEILRHAENSMYRHKLNDGQQSRNQSVRAILKTLWERDAYEKHHSQEVGSLCHALGVAYGIHQEDLIRLRLAGEYHDIGKISIAAAILHKTEPLTAEERTIVKTHAENGYQILKAADNFSDIAPHTLYHHERYDGSGYPQGLAGNDIPLFSRMITIADSYHAMRSSRPYRNKALTKEKAIKHLLDGRGTLYDCDLVNIFVLKVLPHY